ncbi:collagen alpha-1(I) chain-like [Hippopotamus amphibius kiboko]|uniref:collagen alpha-1(I) chain-like n=1 Tax=Hippopotamus amphibius kiboko TaxID=575201 RepID=UPI00259A3C33|nr:collagen alpha-1(I) chain-like [Hippopotamus amphibius kiboko]
MQAPVPLPGAFCLEAGFLAALASRWNGPKPGRKPSRGRRGSGQLPEWDQHGPCRPPSGGTKVGTRPTGVPALFMLPAVGRQSVRTGGSCGADPRTLPCPWAAQAADRRGNRARSPGVPQTLFRTEWLRGPQVSAPQAHRPRVPFAPAPASPLAQTVAVDEARWPGEGGTASSGAPPAPHPVLLQVGLQGTLSRGGLGGGWDLAQLQLGLPVVGSAGWAISALPVVTCWMWGGTAPRHPLKAQTLFLADQALLPGSHRDGQVPPLSGPSAASSSSGRGWAQAFRGPGRHGGPRLVTAGPRLLLASRAQGRPAASGEAEGLQRSAFERAQQGGGESGLPPPQPRVPPASRGCDPPPRAPEQVASRSTGAVRGELLELKPVPAPVGGWVHGLRAGGACGHHAPGRSHGGWALLGPCGPDGTPSQHGFVWGLALPGPPCSPLILEVVSPRGLTVPGWPRAPRVSRSRWGSEATPRASTWVLGPRPRPAPAMGTLAFLSGPEVAPGGGGHSSEQGGPQRGWRWAAGTLAPGLRLGRPLLPTPHAAAGCRRGGPRVRTGPALWVLRAQRGPGQEPAQPSGAGAEGQEGTRRRGHSGRLAWAPGLRPPPTWPLVLPRTFFLSPSTQPCYPGPDDLLTRPTWARTGVSEVQYLSQLGKEPLPKRTPAWPLHLGPSGRLSPLPVEDPRPPGCARGRPWGKARSGDELTSLQIREGHCLSRRHPHWASGSPGPGHLLGAPGQAWQVVTQAPERGPSVWKPPPPARPGRHGSGPATPLRAWGS